MNAFDICESDSFDAVAWDDNKTEKKWMRENGRAPQKIPSNTVQKEVSNADKQSDDKPRFNQENLDKFVSIANQYKTYEEWIKEIRQFYKVSKAMDEKIKQLYESLNVIKE